MVFCKKCGVTFENEMERCPLCFEPAKAEGEINQSITGVSDNHYLLSTSKGMTGPQKMIVWEIVSITIFSIVIITFLIDLIINRDITWAQYPVSVCLIVFSYISFFAFLRKSTTTKMILSIVTSSICLLTVDYIAAGISWSVKLAIPLLFSGNIIVGLLLFVIKKSTHKGINLIAFSFIAIASYCLFIEAVLALYKTGIIHLYWSIIVISCVLPVASVLLFIHFRLTRTQNLERIFHL